MTRPVILSPIDQALETDIFERMMMLICQVWPPAVCIVDVSQRWMTCTDPIYKCIKLNDNR